MENRIVEFVQKLDSEDERHIGIIAKRLNESFGAKFRLNRVEADFLTDHINGKLNFNTPIIKLNNHEQSTN